MSRRPLVIVFARVPQLGRVKTRLARDIGTMGAWRFYRSTLAATLRRLRRDRRWELCVAATPDTLARGGWTPRDGVAVRRQGRGDLGVRMLRAIRGAGRRPVAVVGCDIPDLDATAVSRALRLLASHDAVFGPSRDGGYWLIGWRGAPPPPRLLDGVRWSTSAARADSAARLGSRRVGYADILDDVDEGADLVRLGRARATPSPSVGR
ncbi:MAG: TIGR04282 family arsenosugar biosynthesis glycosyltransferase [Alphaproteobacteria bacterium]|nr:TIGR04282 family arsenosugar biosynthesis glycosyltransferase [Alphaproteobacteria bacterium]